MIKKIQYRWNRVVRKLQTLWKQALCPHENITQLRTDDQFIYSHCEVCNKTLIIRKFY